MRYKVKLKAFEGPFDLLVYLIENAQMSIYDINVSEITEQYMDYIEEMKNTSVSVAAEFMVLAASLIEIKSKMLIPRMNQEGDIITMEDPRTELIERLLEYKRFKAAAAMLSEAEELNLRVFEKPKEDISKYTDQPDIYLKMDISQFVSAFNSFLYKKKKVEEVKKNYARVERQRITVDEKIAYIKAFFKTKMKKSVTFDQLIEGEKNRYNVVITFTSILEMAKSKAVKLTQRSNFDRIVITEGEKIDDK